MTQSLLRLTADERQWNSYRGEGGKPAVILRRYAQTGQVTAGNPIATLIQQGTRRARVFALAFSGDVQALRVRIRVSGGEDFTVGGSVHVPTLSGHSPLSTYSRSALVALYPSTKTATIPATDPALAAAPAWAPFLLEPNLVLPGNQQLICEYSAEDADETYAAAPYQITQVVSVWEFPGYENGAM